MRPTWKAVLSIILFFPAIAAAAPPTYVQSVPLTQLFPANIVGDVKPGPRKVYVITWGGDIATTLANGNAKTTQKGSFFDREGLNITLLREDDFTKQVRAYLAGETPYLRGTMGMINMAVEVASRDPRTEPICGYQHTWSTGGDAMVVRGDAIKSPKDLKGKTIALQAYGPHVDYLFRILADAGIKPNEVTLKWTKDLTDSKQDPATALREDKSVHAVMVITPDAMDLTSQGTVGTGAEKSAKGAKIMLTTKTASRIIADVYCVRRDFLEANRNEVQKFVHGLLAAEESLATLFRQKAQQTGAYGAMLKGAAAILLDKPDTAAIEGMYGDCEYVGYKGNVAFYGNPSNPRSFEKLTEEIQSAFVPLGLMVKKVPLQHARWDYKVLAAGLVNVAGVEAPKFQPERAADVVTRRLQTKTGEGELFAFEVAFAPQESVFSPTKYQESFAQVVQLASRYGGALVTIEGNTDPNEYLIKKRDSAPEVVLTRIQQAAKNLSMRRALAVKDGLIQYAKSKGITLDDTQLVAVGHGFTRSKTGMCGNDPCASKTEDEWRRNMRVEFKMINVEAESSVFTPVGK